MTTYACNDRVYLDRLRVSVGMPPALSPVALAVAEHGENSFEALSLTEFSPAFVSLMRNRLIMGALRYGRIGKRGKPRYDRVQSIQSRIGLYGLTGNQEHLVDVANEALLEFAEPTSHPNPHWAPSDDGETHTEVTKS